MIFGGNLIKDERGKWRTTTFSEGDKYGALGDRLRVLAGADLYRDDSESIIIAVGGRGQLEEFPDSPTIAETIKKELIALGVNGESILTETESGNTFQQLRNMRSMLEKANFQHVTVISNRYHLPRIEAMIEKDPELKQMLDKHLIELKSAEDILIEHDPQWKDEVDKAYAGPEMRERIAKEFEGVRQLKKGTYLLR